MEVLVLLVWVAPIAVIWAVSRNTRARRADRAATVAVEVGLLGVRRSLADGREEAIGWDEVTEVSVLRTSRGPHGSTGGAVVLYGDASRGCMVPLDRAEPSGLVEALTRLPGFDSQRFIDAVRSPRGLHEVWVNPTGGFPADPTLGDGPSR